MAIRIAKDLSLAGSPSRVCGGVIELAGEVITGRQQERRKLTEVIIVDGRSRRSTWRSVDYGVNPGVFMFTILRGASQRMRGCFRGRINRVDPLTIN